MSFSKILVAYDGSKASRKALEKAIMLAKHDPNTALHIINVLQFPVFYLGEAIITTPAGWQADYYQASEEMLAEVRMELASLDNQYEVFQLDGQPAESILAYSREKNCDLIVIGSRGLGNLREFVLGSVSHNVVQHSTIPVLVVK